MKYTDIEKGCSMPENISFRHDKKTKKLFNDIEKLCSYFNYMTGLSNVNLCEKYLKILN